MAAAGSVAEGGPLEFVVRADPAPAADLTVRVTVEASGCTLAQAPKSVTIDARKTEATLTVRTSDAGVGAEGCRVTAAIAAGAGYQVGAATAASAGATVTPGSGMPMQPVVTIRPTASSVTEGSPVSFTLTAAPAPASALTVNVSWSDPGSFLTGSRSQTVTIPTSGTATLTADTADDGTDEPDGSVTVAVEAGSGYTVGTPHSATVAVTDDDTATTGGSPSSPQQPAPVGPRPVVTVTSSTSSATVGDPVTFTFTARPAPASTVTVSLYWAPVGATATGIRDEVRITTSGTAQLQIVISTVIPAVQPPRTISVYLDPAAGDPYTTGLDQNYARVTVNP